MTIFLGQPFLLGDDQSSQWRPFLLHQQEESWALPTRLRCSGNGTGPDFKNAEEGKSLTWFLQGSQKTASKVWSVSILYFLSNLVLCSIRIVKLWQNLSWLFNKNQKKVWHCFWGKGAKGQTRILLQQAQHFRFSFTSDPNPRWDKSLAWHWTGLPGASPPPLCGRLLTVSTVISCLGGEIDDQSMQRSQYEWEISPTWELVLVSAKYPGGQLHIAPWASWQPGGMGDVSQFFRFFRIKLFWQC